ncbi:adenosylcobinamide-phosphate synthase [Paucimonas lemoignei]|uniref:Cobalamin biosynthesis protein CobD n=1 Tax=Paucimonas lemoignei TaxID=29443 RepID=A0A4R3HWH6_PAULE|nr:CobD/CbiB family protein [Paucimonas lemoignei]TCS36475.1 adenosylcobinamide-phosphate synthase [Paucimonas lemoignei]
MTFFAILLVLLIEQVQPLRADNPVHAALRTLASRMEARFNAGLEQHGRVAWLATMAIVVLPTALVYWLCTYLGFLAVFAWTALVAYLTLGFRHYSHYFTSIQIALSSGDEESARRLLAEWTGADTSMLDSSELSRIAVETALVTAHRNVFGVFFWLLLPVGPAFAVMYRVAEYLARAWNEPDHLKNEAFGRFASRAFYWIDWIPARLTAIAFAVVGNFEDAIYSWRNFAQRWPDEAIGVLLSAGGGALGVRLGTPSVAAASVVTADASLVDTASVETETLPGDAPQPRTLQSAVGLVWRALLLWMLMLLLISIALWVG